MSNLSPHEFYGDVNIHSGIDPVLYGSGNLFIAGGITIGSTAFLGVYGVTAQILASPIITILGTSSAALDVRSFNTGTSVATVDAKVFVLGTSSSALDVRSFNTGTSVATVDSKVFVLGTSYLAHELKITNLSVSSTILDTFRASAIGTSFPNLLSRNETILPSTFITSSLTSLGSLTSLSVSGNVAITGELTVNGANVSAGSNTIRLAMLADQKSSGTDGGSYTQPNLVTRALNTIVSDPYSIIVVLASNRFTLGPGSYLIEAHVPGNNLNSFMGVIRNVTANTYVYGETMYAGGNTMLRSNVRQQVTLIGNTVFEINMIGTHSDSRGCGVASGLNTETYTTVSISQLV